MRKKFCGVLAVSGPWGRFSCGVALAVVGVCGGTVVPASGQTDPPAGYYGTATGTGATLKSQLHNIIDGHQIFSYNALRSLLQITDAIPGQPGFMDVVYDTAHVNVAAINPNGSIPGWDQADTWNREHTWPRSRGVGSSGADNSDMHQLRPSLTQTNSDRGSFSFGGAYGSLGGNYGLLNDGGTVWYPGDEDAGRIARQQFYMAVRYDGSDSSTSDLELSNSANPGTNQLGKLDRLLEWHYQATPDDFELLRNERVYGYQNNRNPFIDRPELAWSVFADQQNDSQIYLGGVANADGGSSVDVALPPVYAGVPSSVLPTERVLLNKLGNDGTYFEVQTAGGATSSVTGRFNAMPITSASLTSEDLFVGLDTDTSTAGLKQGTVTVDNLDVTTQGGAGRGGNDADDVVNVSLSVFDHATPSLVSDSVATSVVLDLGVIALDSEETQWTVPFFNLEQTPGFTARMALMDVMESNGNDDFTLLVDTPVLVAGDSGMLTLSVDSGSLGSRTDTWVLDFVEESFLGAESLDALTLEASVTVALLGDANLNGSVEQADLDVVLSAWGQSGGLGWIEGDFDGDGGVSQADLDAVLTNWGATSVPNLRGVVVPEPLACGVLIGLAFLACRRRA